MKNIYPKIQIHPFFYLVSFLAFITGNFKSFCLFMSILIVHECGHILAALYFHWNILTIFLFPFGALTMFQDHLNKPIKEELIIVLMGPIFQCIFYYILSIYSLPYLKSFHYGLLFFNLLPIVPLDGSKIVTLFYQRFLSYWGSYYWAYWVSIISFPLIFFIQKESLITYLVAIILFHKVVTTFEEKHIVFSKFILERILYNFSFPRRKIIKGEHLKKMKRDTKHIFYINGYYYTEQQALQKTFDLKGKT